MSCFKLSPGICKKITSMVSNYWWGSSVDNHKIHWLRWEKLTRPKIHGGMGFRDFNLFNQAMLGKQGWRLLMRPDSLCAKVLKGKYYPSTDFLSATKKKRSSATCRSILWGREELKKGLIKRVGPGDIDVWRDNWIPGLRPFKPLVRLPTAEVDKVADLFIPGTRLWDEQEVRRSFLALEAEEVLKIKPSLRLQHDVLAWALEKNGTYSVRSAYRMLKDDHWAVSMAGSNEQAPSEQSNVWRALWRVNVPPKIRVFWWRVIHNSLPSKSEMKRRHIEKESFCEVCGDPDESLYHVFFLCPVAKRLWAEIKRLFGIRINTLHPQSWTADIFRQEVCSSSSVEWLICGAWALWNGRNNRRHGRKVWEPGAIARYISGLIEEMSFLKMPAKSKNTAGVVHWKPPMPGWVKINTDASFNPNSSSGAAGVVIRDDMGAVCSGAARWFDNVQDALMAEALAAREGLELAVEMGYDRIILEVDCKNLKTLIEDGSGVRSSIGGLCFDITELSKMFSEFRIEWVSRGANSVAHYCACTVSATERSLFWRDDVPDWLSKLAAFDCNLIPS